MSLDTSENTDDDFDVPVLNMQVTEALLERARPGAIFLHCLPGRRESGEMAAARIEGSESIIFDQTHNRLHVQKALLLHASKFGTFPPHNPDIKTPPRQEQKQTASNK